MANQRTRLSHYERRQVECGQNLSVEGNKTGSANLRDGANRRDIRSLIHNNQSRRPLLLTGNQSLRQPNPTAQRAAKAQRHHRAAVPLPIR